MKHTIDFRLQKEKTFLPRCSKCTQPFGLFAFWHFVSSFSAKLYSFLHTQCKSSWHVINHCLKTKKIIDMAVCGQLYAKIVLKFRWKFKMFFPYFRYIQEQDSYRMALCKSGILRNSFFLRSWMKFNFHFCERRK